MYRTAVLSFLLSIAVLSPLSAESYGPVKRGEYLSIIAQNTRPDLSLSLAQVMVAIYLKNPDAFFGGSVNLLSEGSELTLPTADEIRSIPVLLAKAEMRRQNEAWEKLGFDLATIPLSMPELSLSQSPVAEENPDALKPVSAVGATEFVDSSTAIITDVTEGLPDVAEVVEMGDLATPTLAPVGQTLPDPDSVVADEMEIKPLESQPEPIDAQESVVKKSIEILPTIIDQPIPQAVVEESVSDVAVSPLDSKSIGLYLAIALFVVFTIYLLFFRKSGATPNLPEQEGEGVEPISFDFSEDPGPTINPAQIEAQMAAITLSQYITISDRKFFDVGVAKIEGYDEIPLKLDLAKAYVDLMNLTEGSRLLNEVMLAGSGEQKKEAADMMEWVSLIMREDAQVSG